MHDLLIALAFVGMVILPALFTFDPAERKESKK